MNHGKLPIGETGITPDGDTLRVSTLPRSTIGSRTRRRRDPGFIFKIVEDSLDVPPRDLLRFTGSRGGNSDFFAHKTRHVNKDSPETVS